MNNVVVYNTEECTRYPGYYYIPNYSDYCINVHGIVVKISTGKCIMMHITPPGKKGIKGGYRRCRLQNDDGVKKSIGRHKLLCIVFKPVPASDAKYIVNHKDGIPGNDDLDNREWVTYSQNTKHAYDTGLYPNKQKTVLIKQRDTGEIFTFKGTPAASKFLNVSENTLQQRALRSGGRFYDDGYAVIYAGIGKWGDPDIVRKSPTSRAILARDLRNRIVYIFDNIDAASRLLDILSSSIHVALKRPFGKRLLKGYDFKYAGETLNWTEYTEEQINWCIKYPSGHFPKMVVVKLEDETIFTGDTVEVCALLNCSSASIYRACNNNGLLNGYSLVWKHILY